MAVPSRRRLRKYIERQLSLRARLWPDITDNDLWVRTERDGFITIPRTMPLILDIMDDMANGQPISSTYLELWCRSFDECFVTLSKPREIAFHSGFTGQRAERTWAGRMRLLDDLGFIRTKEGASGPLTYALILNPYHVIKGHHDKRTPGLRSDKYNALMARAVEIGATDLDEPSPEPVEAASPAKPLSSLDDEIPF
jgi:hypothetical protein